MKTKIYYKKWLWNSSSYILHLTYLLFSYKYEQVYSLAWALTKFNDTEIHFQYSWFFLKLQPMSEELVSAWSKVFLLCYPSTYSYLLISYHEIFVHRPHSKAMSCSGDFVSHWVHWCTCAHPWDLLKSVTFATPNCKLLITTSVINPKFHFNILIPKLWFWFNSPIPNYRPRSRYQPQVFVSVFGHYGKMFQIWRGPLCLIFSTISFSTFKILGSACKSEDTMARFFILRPNLVLFCRLFLPWGKYANDMGKRESTEV